MEVKFIKKNNGQTLRIRLIADRIEKKEIREDLKKKGSDCVFWDLTEGYWTNGWGVIVADVLGQLSECIVIVESESAEDDGSHTLAGKAWTNHDNYQVVCPVSEMLTKGYADFKFWQDFGEGENFPNILEVK